MKIKLSIITLILAASLGIYGCSNSDKSGSTKAESPDTKTNKIENTPIVNADEALKKLKEGNERFVKDESKLINLSAERRKELTTGQKPYAVVVSCSDSRITPTHVFNAGLGEIFDVRLAGNVVDDNALGSIEYAVSHLGTPLIVVMGHESCGAVTVAYDQVNKGTKAEGNIEDLVEEIEPSVKETKTLDEAIHKNAENVMKEIQQDTIIKKLIDEGKVKVIKSYYSLDGKVTFE